MPHTKPESSVASDDGDEDYRTKRDRNNEAVKKSRVKSKQKTKETQDRVEALKGNIMKLEEKIDNHRKTLKLLKELFLAQAKAKTDTITSEALQLLLKDDEDDEEEAAAASTSRRSSATTKR